MNFSPSIKFDVFSRAINTIGSLPVTLRRYHDRKKVQPSQTLYEPLLPNVPMEDAPESTTRASAPESTHESTLESAHESTPESTTRASAPESAHEPAHEPAPGIGRVRGSIRQLFPPVIRLAPGRVWEAFLFDGREIMHVAQLLECGPGGLCAEAVEYALAMTSFTDGDRLISDAATKPAADVRRAHISALIRALFSKHASTYGFQLSDAIDRWRPKMLELYGECICASGGVEEWGSD